MHLQLPHHFRLWYRGHLRSQVSAQAIQLWQKSLHVQCRWGGREGRRSLGKPAWQRNCVDLPEGSYKESDREVCIQDKIWDRPNGLNNDIQRQAKVNIKADNKNGSDDHSNIKQRWFPRPLPCKKQNTNDIRKHNNDESKRLHQRIQINLTIRAKTVKRPEWPLKLPLESESDNIRQKRWFKKILERAESRHIRLKNRFYSF